jgi:hypothetical protein
MPMKMAVRIAVSVVLGASLALAACSDDSGKAPVDSAPLVRADGGTKPSVDGQVKPGSDAQAPECYQDPKTHAEIINACTTAQFVDKTPFYPAKAPNGVLPALP